MWQLNYERRPMPPATTPAPSHFVDFYPLYLKMHSHPTCRRLHVLGNLLALGALAIALTTRNPWIVLTAPVSANLCAWIGHIFFQRNRPGILRYPLYGALGNLVMTADILRGRLRW